MKDAAPGTASSAVEHTRELLTESPLRSRPSLEYGYLDLLDRHQRLGPAFPQRAMGNAAVVRVYERLWRPLGVRAVFGPGGPGAAQERAIALSMLDVSSGSRVLDVGCGPGNYTKDLGRAADDGLVIGLDASAPMLRRAVRRASAANVAYVRGDAAALPFRAEQFDVVGCFATLHLLEEPLKALAEMVRVLGPGGSLGLLTTCAHPRPRHRGRLRAPRGVRMFGRDELTEALAAHGLDDVQQRVIGRGQLVGARKKEDGDG